MANKVNFDIVNKIIQVTIPPSPEGVVELDIKIDVYSDGKEDWLANSSLRKRPFPIIPVGGNVLPNSRQLGSTFFLYSDWKIRPYEADHTFKVTGNLYSVDGTSPFTHTIGSYNVLLEQHVSSLVDSTLNIDAIASGVWDEPLHNHNTIGSFGHFIQNKLLTVVKFLGLK